MTADRRFILMNDGEGFSHNRQIQKFDNDYVVVVVVVVGCFDVCGAVVFAFFEMTCDDVGSQKEAETWLAIVRRPFD